MKNLRYATLDDIEPITELIGLTACILGEGFYDKPTIESSLLSAFSVDTQLIKDQTYFVIEQQKKLIAYGAWSSSKTLSGIDFYKKNGFQGDKYIYHDLDKDTIIKFLPMTKEIH
jgi:hypothetical protein